MDSIEYLLQALVGTILTDENSTDTITIEVNPARAYLILSGLTALKVLDPGIGMIVAPQSSKLVKEIVAAAKEKGYDSFGT